MRTTLQFLLFAAFTTTTPIIVQAAPVSVQSQYTGGLYGAFSLQYDSAPAGLQLQEVKFDLVSPLYLDPTFAPPGALLPLPFLGGSGIAQTGFSGVTGVTDGANSFSLTFSNFDAGESFSFNLDVDGPCGGFICLPGALTAGSEFAGTTITAYFGGNGYQTTSLVSQFSSTGALTASTTLSGDVAPTPEPATMALMGVSMAALGVYAKRRQRNLQSKQ